jgi:site-specific DNA recombinase
VSSEVDSNLNAHLLAFLRWLVGDADELLMLIENPLDRLLVWNEAHRRHALREYERHYNLHRTHRPLAAAAPLKALPETLAAERIDRRAVRRQDRLGGVAHEYRPAADHRGWRFRHAQRGTPGVSCGESALDQRAGCCALCVLRFAFYGRVSTVRHQDTTSSRGWQRDMTSDLVAGHGRLVVEFFDVGCSRRVPWCRRPRARELLAAVAAPGREFDAIVVGEYERAFFGDQLGELLPVLNRHGVGLWLPEVGGRLDVADPVHVAVVRVLGAQSKREVVRARSRVLAAMQVQVREEGRYLGGRPPYGYRLVDAGAHPNGEHARWGRRRQRLAVDPVTGPQVCWMFAQRLAGMSAAGIARSLNERGVACPSVVDPTRNRHRHRGVWAVRSVASILGNPRYTGWQVWNRQPVDHGRDDGDRIVVGQWRRWSGAGEWVVSRRRAHPALVSEEDFVAAQAITARERPRDGSVRRYALVGLVRCGVCGRRMESCWVHGRAGYRCRHGHSSGKASAAGVRVPNLYRREDRILDQIADRVEPGGLGAGHASPPKSVDIAAAVRTHQLMIVCQRDDRVTVETVTSAQ